MLSLGFAIAVAAAVAVCIGVLIALVLLGVRRYWSASEPVQPSGTKQGVEAGIPCADDKQEMEWDNSALNIIVNPLEGLGGRVPRAAATAALDSDDDESANCDEASSDDEREMPRCRELEWDDSTLSF